MCMVFTVHNLIVMNVCSQAWFTVESLSLCMRSRFENILQRTCRCKHGIYMCFLHFYFIQLTCKCI